MKLPNFATYAINSLSPKMSSIESKFSVNLPGGFVFAPSLIQALAIIILIFILIISLGQLRRRYVDWHLHGILPGIVFGFILAIVLEGFLIISGKTVITGLLGWKNAPEPILNILDLGHQKLLKTLN